MTRYEGVLSPAVFPGPCDKCEHLRVQAERAFSELRHEADLHVAAVQKKLRDDFGKEIAKLKAANQQLQSELSFALKKTGQAPADAHSHNRFNALEADLRSVERARKDELARAARETDVLTKTHNSRVAILESKLENTEAQVNQLREELHQATLNSEISKGQLQNQCNQSDHRIQRLESERDDLILSNNALKVKLASSEKSRHDLGMERAKQDLAYRRRVGEMEMEVRRADIESVRLRNQILALTQKMESMGFSTSTPTPKLPLPCESEDIEVPRIGRITRVHPSASHSEYADDTPISLN